MISKMTEILCPLCNQSISIGTLWCICDKGHKFPVKGNIIDFLPNMNDEDLKEEEQHWDRYAEER